jgi:sugar lactone lactonase YvrE
MGDKGRIVRVLPAAAFAGGEVMIECEGFDSADVRYWDCRIGGRECRLVGASKRRILALVPEDIDAGEQPVEIAIGNVSGAHSSLIVGSLVAEDLHPVANPAIDPQDGTLYVTRSGSRGQELPVSIFKIDPDGDIEGFSGEVTNPTGLAFDSSGSLFVSSRLNGTVYRFDPLKGAVPFAQNLGVATGIAFDGDGNLFVGDRSGVIYRVNGIGEAMPWTTHEPSVSAYHLAFGPDGSLYVAGPTVSSFDSITRFDKEGRSSVFFRGLGRPQGLAFDLEGNLYVAASYRGRRGIIRISPQGEGELVVAGMNAVGLCFSPSGDMIIATTEAVHNVPFGIHGTLLPGQ